MLIAGEPFLVHTSLPPGTESLRNEVVPLPSHRAIYRDALRPVVDAVLTEEGLVLNQLKARILTKAYLPKSSRSMLLILKEPMARRGKSGQPGSAVLTVTFFLPPGAYATLVFKVMSATLPAFKVS